jgi:hypothetical protein
MTAKEGRSRIVTGLLVTMLLPAGAILAQSRIEPGNDPCPVEQDQEIGLRPAAATDRQLPLFAGGLFRAEGLGGAITFGDPLGASPHEVEASSGTAPVALASTNVTAPWFRKTFVLFRTDGTCPVKPTAGAPSTERPAKAHRAIPEVQSLGTVQNLRRTDQQ